MESSVLMPPLEAKSAKTLASTTVLRFAHAFESGGGTERYLDDLDRALLERNEMTIVRLHLTRNQSAHRNEESIGKGRLIRVPLPVSSGDKTGADNDDHGLKSRVKRGIRDWVIYNPFIWRAGGARWTAAYKLPRQSGQAIDAGHAAEEVLQSRRIDLAVLHFFGGADADEVLNQAKRFQVPVALLNHFSNDRFMNLAIRKHAMQADAVAGVNGLDIPNYLKGSFTNLADGIDTEFFDRRLARPLKNAPAQPIVFMPARLVPEKGQMDLVSAAALLRQSGIECNLAFAGRPESPNYLEELRQAVVRANMTEAVHFLGALDLETLRDWYAASAVVALPTYHHEGLPRIVLEAQAMGTPLVAYATGGVADGIDSGRTGYLLPTGDVRGLTDRLRELLASPELRLSLGANGRQTAEDRFSLSALAARHENFYSQLIARSRAAN